MIKNIEEESLMFYIIIVIILIVGVFCLIKCMRNWWDDNTICSLISGICAIGSLILFYFSSNNYSNTFSTVSTNTAQYDIVEFNQSTSINKSDESYIITYKTKDNNEFKISADNNTNIVIDNDNPTKVTVNEELKYSEWFFAHKKTVTYTFQ